MRIKRIGILYHPMVEATCVKAREVANFLTSRGIENWMCSAWETAVAEKNLDSSDLLLTAGGDGTILRAAQVGLKKQIPITGINMGNLGFLTEIKANEALERLSELLTGKGWIDERIMLEASLSPETKISSMTQVSAPVEGPYYALNDIVLGRGSIVKLVQIKVTVDKNPLTTYRADGVILATATGSTGYSLAAGGPVLYPQSMDYLLVPIVSHLSPGYPLVLPSSSVVDLHLTTTHQATLSIDGHINIVLSDGAGVTIKKSQYKTRFLRLHRKDYFFPTLEEKMRGKK